MDRWMDGVRIKEASPLVVESCSWRLVLHEFDEDLFSFSVFILKNNNNNNNNNDNIL